MATHNISVDVTAGVSARVDCAVSAKNPVDVVTLLMAGDFVFSADAVVPYKDPDIHADFGTAEQPGSGAGGLFHPGSVLPCVAVETVRQRTVSLPTSEENPDSEVKQKQVEDATVKERSSQRFPQAVAGTPEVHDLNKGHNPTADVSVLATCRYPLSIPETDNSDIFKEHESGPWPGRPGFADDVLLPPCCMPDVGPDVLQPGITNLSNPSCRSKSPDNGSTPEIPACSHNSPGFDTRPGDFCLTGRSQSDPDTGMQGLPLNFCLTAPCLRFLRKAAASDSGRFQSFARRICTD